MPIYEYVCQECGNRFEVLVTSQTAPVQNACDTCGSVKTSKTMSTFSSPSAASSAPVSLGGGGGCSPNSKFS